MAKFEEAIYVLHCFHKKTQATSKHDEDIAQIRYRAVIKKRSRAPSPSFAETDQRHATAQDSRNS
nr:type II toxin-antitoxin system RelE/ParE family toxin [Nitrosospira multiformis]